MKCLNCNKTLTSKRSDAKFCSAKCRLAYFRTNETDKPEANKGYVYIFQCNEFYKIGVTNDVIERIGTIRTANPYEINLIFSAYIKSPYQLEGSLHTCFEPKRAKGEWFKLNKDDLDIAIKLISSHYLANPSQYLLENPIFKSIIANNVSNVMGKVLG